MGASKRTLGSTPHFYISGEQPIKKVFNCLKRSASEQSEQNQNPGCNNPSSLGNNAENRSLWFIGERWLITLLLLDGYGVTDQRGLKPGHSLRGGAPFIPGDKNTLMFLVVGAHRDFSRLSQLTSSLASAYLEWGWNNLLMPLFYTFQILLDLMDQILSVKRVISRRWWHLFRNVSLWGKVFCVCM